MEHSIGVGAIVGLTFASSIYIWNSNKFTSQQKIVLLICFIFPPIQWLGVILVLVYNDFKTNSSGEKVKEKNIINDKKNLDDSIESLTNLKNKGIITEDFYYEKVAKIKTKKLKEELQNSLEYKQLYGLFSSGILTEKEFESKVRLIKTEVQILKDNITKYLSKKDLDIIKVHFGRNNKKVNVQLRTKLEKVLKIQTNLSDVELIEIIIKELEKT